MTDQSYLLREATTDDIPTLLLFEQEIIKVERPFDPTIAPDPVSYYDIAAYVSDPDVGVYVIEWAGEVVSSGYAKPQPARHYLDHEYYAHLGFMYTAPEHRGKGLNRQIIEALTKWAKAHGLSEVRLTVYDDNALAIKAYEKVGLKKHIIEMRRRLIE